MKLPFIERIWCTEGYLTLTESLSPSEAFERLDPLLQANGTTFAIDGDTLTYSKGNPAAQDKMATFTSGTLQVSPGEGGSKLRYRLVSPALLMCFLAPLLFLAFAQATVLINELEKPSAEEKAKAAEEEKEEDKEVKPLHPIDAFLGAPAPEKPEDKDKDKDKEKKDKGHSSTPAYVLAALFAALYLVGRILEPWLIRRHLSTALASKPVSTGEVNSTSEVNAPQAG